MNTSNNNNIEENNAILTKTEFSIEQPAKVKTTILYSDLTDNSELTRNHIKTDPHTTETTTETYKIISEQFADSPTNFSTPAQSNSLKPQTIDETVITTLHKEHKSVSLTDDNILEKSHQLSLTQDDQLEDDKTATGTAVEHMDVVLKQWYFTVQWQRTEMPKSGIYNKFKKRTQLMDVDLSCLLCNRYGEVIETIWFKNVRNKAESIRHQGDELLGKKPFSKIDEDTENPYGQESNGLNDPKINQESIVIHLNKLPPQVFHVVLIVSSYHGYPLAKANEALCQLSDDEGNMISELAFAKLPSDAKALWFASLTRSADSWRYNTEHQPLAHFDMTNIQKEVSDNLVRTAR